MGCCWTTRSAALRANAQKILLDNLIEIEALSINDKYFDKDDPERIERIKLPIKMLGEEMNKGAEVHPSLSAPESTSKIFPDMKNLSILLSRVKEIPDKKEKSDDQGK